MTDDVGAASAAIIGFSIAINHGIASKRSVARANPAVASPRLAFPTRPALQP